MEFSAPGVPSKGMPRARARMDCCAGGGEVWGSRALRSGRKKRSARATSRGEIAFMAEERNFQRPTSNVQRSMKREEVAADQGGAVYKPPMLFIPRHARRFGNRRSLVFVATRDCGFVVF